MLVPVMGDQFMAVIDYPTLLSESWPYETAYVFDFDAALGEECGIILTY